MSFSSLEAGHEASAGHSASAGAILYLLRTLERDLRERGVRAEVDAWLNRAGVPDDTPDLSDRDLADWLLTDDSPLLLDNVGEFVLDPDAHLRAIAERLEGINYDRPPPGRELTIATPRLRAGELQARLRTFAELDAERVAAAPRRRGTPRGETRTHYVLLVSPPRDISNAEFKRLILEVIRGRWPGAVVVGYIHRDTDNTHLHVWMSAETVSGRKIDVRRLTPSGDAVLDKYPDLDEEVARAFSRHFGDPSIYNDHIAKKLEWVYWRERFEATLVRGQRPPVMPYRARHDYDWVAERRAVADREKGESRHHSGKVEKAAPIPRAKSLMGALELWGKTVYFEARVRYRRELLASPDAWRDRIDLPIAGLKEDFEASLAEAERDYERHKNAFERTLENRAEHNYPDLKYPLHHRNQIAEMEEVARLMRDAELLRHVRSYTALDRPMGGEGEGQERYAGTLWRDHIEARLEVLERAEMLAQVVGQQGVPAARSREAAASHTGHPPFDHDAEIMTGWLAGGWTLEQMRDSLTCFESDGVRLHAGRYLKAREYFAATGEALDGCREGTTEFVRRPALEESDLSRIGRLAGGDVAAVGERERALLLDLASCARGELGTDRGRTAQLLESSLSLEVSHSGDAGRTGVARGRLAAFRPHDDAWAGRLAGLLTLRETEALALAAGGAPRERFDAAREDVYGKYSLMELTRQVRAAAGLSPDAAAVLGSSEERALERHLGELAEALRSRGSRWKDWQAEGVEEFKHVLPPREREGAGRVVVEVKARLEEERRAEALRGLLPAFEAAARLHLRDAYRDEGLDGMREPSRRQEHVRGLAGKFSQVASEAGHDLAGLGLTPAHLEARAGRDLTEAVERFGREERETYELGRFEARMILACAEWDGAAARLQRFDDHASFHSWGYRTREGSGSTSLCEALLSAAETTDRAALLVAQDAADHVARSVQEEQDRLVEAVNTRAAEAEAATHAYEARASEASQPEVMTRGPVFEPGELKRLEEVAFVTRDPSLTGLVTRCEGEMYGQEYAGARALGRALRAAAVWSAEFNLAAKYEYPVVPGRLGRLGEASREFISERLARHRAAREDERAAADAFRTGVEAQTNEHAGAAPRTPHGHPVPLVTEAEAREIFARRAGMSHQQQRSWDKMTMHAELVVEGGGPGGAHTRSLHEWGMRHMASITRGSEYERFIGDVKVLSYNDARTIARQQEKEQGLNRTTSRSR